MNSIPEKDGDQVGFPCIKKKGDSEVVDVINKLQNKLASDGKLLQLSLPQIVVEGAQSSSKVSLKIYH
ncbi:hypothetical protein CEXT_676351 [Caerostris extrusa]|uniref:Uncharacterized protein n=1 Tax=Caerostris extrusa TaxID=172846 RepID=A0AAV4X611_CAEEX|nr:hypothetical protein CEXT_676351 [Caerostris extrusa]